VNEALRVFATVQLGFTEVAQGWFKKVDPEGGGTMNIDFRPTGKNVNGHPKGRLYVRRADGSYMNDEKGVCENFEQLAHYRLFQQKIWADQDLDGTVKKTTHEENVSGSGSGELENPVTEEIKVGAPAKVVERREAVKEPEIVSGGAKTATPTIPAGRNLPSVPAQSNALALNKGFMHDIKGTPSELAVTLGGKKYATKLGRWFILHSSGRKIKSSRIEILHTSFDPETRNGYPAGVAAVKSIIELFDGGVFEALGEAYVIRDSAGKVIATNVNMKMEGVALNLDHLAETRAKARCLGDITAGGWYDGNPNKGMVEDLKHVEGCSAEELREYGGNEAGDY
jgi:hypothetical protein